MSVHILYFVFLCYLALVEGYSTDESCVTITVPHKVIVREVKEELSELLSENLNTNNYEKILKDLAAELEAAKEERKQLRNDIKNLNKQNQLILENLNISFQQGRDLADNHPIRITASSQADCRQKCELNQEFCTWYCYQPVSSMCSLFSIPSLPNESFAVGGRSYACSNFKTLFHDAVQFCKENGASLFTPVNEFENEQMRSRISKEIWIGLTDEKKEGVWLTPNGDNHQYFNWADEQPNNENYGLESVHYAVYNSTNGKWNDVSVTVRNKYCCQSPASDVIPTGDVPGEYCYKF